MNLTRASHIIHDKCPTRASWGKFKSDVLDFYNRREKEIGIAFLFVAFAFAAAKCSPVAVENAQAPPKAAVSEGQGYEGRVLIAEKKDPQLGVIAREIAGKKQKTLPDPLRMVHVRENESIGNIGMSVTEFNAALDGKDNFRVYRATLDDIKMLRDALKILESIPFREVRGVPNWRAFVERSLDEVWLNPMADFCTIYAGAYVAVHETHEKNDNVRIRKQPYFNGKRVAIICPGSNVEKLVDTLVHEARHSWGFEIPKEHAGNPEMLRKYDENASDATQELFYQNSEQRISRGNKWMHENRRLHLLTGSDAGRKTSALHRNH